MKRILLSGFLGGIAYFIWGNLAWMVVPLHMPTISMLPNEADVSENLKNLESGVYVAPWSSNEEDWNDPESDWSKRHASGPLYTIYIQHEGEDAMPASMMINGFIIDFLAATLAACLLSSAIAGNPLSYMQRVGFVLGMGIFVALLSHLAYWNWMHFELRYTIGFVIDVVVGCTLMGLVVAAIVKPVPNTDESEPDAGSA
ncbi:MAG: hypothetical protein CMJ78_11495 [Planctomycetaceae bacterium]|nr:hypothetical protein [Planctomycetaceae bacterium]